MSDIEISNEIKKKAFEMDATVKVFQLNQFAEIINLASTRGAFKGNELTSVGTIYDKLKFAINEAIKIAKNNESIKISKDNKLDTIIEEEESS